MSYAKQAKKQAPETVEAKPEKPTVNVRLDLDGLSPYLDEGGQLSITLPAYPVPDHIQVCLDNVADNLVNAGCIHLGERQEWVDIALTGIDRLAVMSALRNRINR